MASSTAIIALLVVARNHIESITQQICAKPCSKANPRDFRNPALLEMSQRYAITQTKSQLFLNFTHLRTTNAIGYQRFDLEKSGTYLRVGQKRLGKLGGDVFATRRFAIACDSRPYSCCKICAIPVNSCQNRGGRPTTSRQKRRPRRTLRRGRRWNGCWLRRRSAAEAATRAASHAALDVAALAGGHTAASCAEAAHAAGCGG